MPLTPKQQRFVEEYLVDLDPGAAYRRAGYKVRTDKAASNCGLRLLENVGVKTAIAAGRTAQKQRLQLEADDVLRELLLVGKSDLGDVLDFTGTEPRLRPACEIPEAARRAIASVKVRRFTEGHGDNAREVEVTEFKLWDKIAALDKLARHLGLLKTVHEHTGKDGAPIQFIEVAAPDA
jgi:phage terminase small subunit